MILQVSTTNIIDQCKRCFLESKNQNDAIVSLGSANDMDPLVRRSPELRTEFNEENSEEYSIVELIEHDVAKCCCNKVKTPTKAFEDVNGKSSYW